MRTAGDFLYCQEDIISSVFDQPLNPRIIAAFARELVSVPEEHQYIGCGMPYELGQFHGICLSVKCS